VSFDHLRTGLFAIEMHVAGIAGHDEALRVIRRRLEDTRAREPSLDITWVVDSPQLQRVFAALCARYGIEPFRRPRQRMSTVNIHVPRSWGEEVFGRVFDEMAPRISEWLDAQTDALMDACGAPVPAGDEDG